MAGSSSTNEYPNGQPGSTASKEWDSPDQNTILRLRKKIASFSKMGRFCAAEFWMDKIANLSNYQNLADVLGMCEYLFLDGQYEACRRIIEKRSLHKKRTDFRYLLGRCYFTSGDLDEALKVTAIGDTSNTDGRRSSVSRNGEDMTDLSLGSFKGISMYDDEEDCQEYLAAIFVLRGKIFDKLENPQNACQAYRKALEIDPYSFDALEMLANRKAVSAEDQERLVKETSENCDDGENLVHYFYENQLCTETDRPKFDPLWEKSKFARNPDFLLFKADRALTRRDFVSCLELTQKIFAVKPYYRRALPVHIAALVHLGKSSQLFDLSHRLVSLYPQEVLPWYATASYYFVCGHMDLTRRHLSKAIAMDKSCGYVWLLYGHSFSREKEHDQAMAAYFHAVDVMRGSYFPYLYIAREYTRTNNYLLAEKFYDEARKIAPEDSVVLHELGILHIKKSESSRQAASLEARRDLTLAAKHLSEALCYLKMDTRGQRMMDQAVEGVYESLAAVHLKLKDPKEALLFAKLALQINATNSTVLKIIGMSNVMLGKPSAAIDAFQRSLALGKDDQQTKKMLSETVELCMLEGASAVIPVVDLTAKRRTRVAKGPIEISRTPSKRLSLRKEAAPLNVSSTYHSAMDMSIASTSDASFMGEFRAPSGAIENVSVEFFDDV